MIELEKASQRTISSVQSEMDEVCKAFADTRKSQCFPLLLGGTTLRSALVDRVYDDLREGKYTGKSLDVIIDSQGGDINAAYNLALLFRRYGSEKLTFLIPRWAKSAATLLTCGGDEILMTPVAELGPLDPQITEMNPLEQRMEQFSPIHIESTLELIRDEFTNGNSQLAEGLMQRLQFPLTLGSFKKSLDVGREYVGKLLSSRMLKGQSEKAKEIGEVLTTGYADHSWCITIEEAKKLGLVVKEIEGECLDKVWEIHKLNKEKENLIRQKNKETVMDQLKNLHPDLLDDILSDSTKTELNKEPAVSST